MTRPGRYSGFQATGMIKWRQKSKTKKIPRASNTNPPKNSLDKKLTSKKSHAEFSSLKVLNIFQKEVNDKAQKINQELNVCVCSRIHWHNQESSVCSKYLEKSLLACTPSHPKIYSPNLPESKISNPQKILRSSPSLEIRSTPPGITCGNVWLSLL